MTATLRETVIHWLLPQTCAGCREDLPKGWDAPLCAACQGALPPAEPPFCLRCAERVDGSSPHCAACSSRLSACRMIRAAFLYKGPIPPLVHAFKYRGRVGAARWAGQKMAQAFARYPELSGFDALVPVPLHRLRLRERGYNQADLLAAELSASTGLPVWQAVTRVEATRPQWRLDRGERLKNLAGAFRGQAQARGRKLLLIDDVCTSGASLEGCAKALQQAGAAQVCAYVLARQTPR
ncbi:MAG: ComF family protein [Elusimicrobiota bacterium]